MYYGDEEVTGSPICAAFLGMGRFRSLFSIFFALIVVVTFMFVVPFIPMHFKETKGDGNMPEYYKVSQHRVVPVV